jgi:hypothetical protein
MMLSRLRNWWNGLPDKPWPSEDDIRRIVREEVLRGRKSGCKNFSMRDGKGYCRNCGFHHDEH